MSEEGIRLETQRTEIVGAEEQIRPLRDFLLLRPLPWEPSRTIQIAGNTRRTLCGEVIAKGPGCYPLRYNRERSECWHSPAFRPTACEIGDIVELGGLHLDGYSFFRIQIGNDPYLLCRDEDVCAIVSSLADRQSVEVTDQQSPTGSNGVAASVRKR